MGLLVTDQSEESLELGSGGEDDDVLAVLVVLGSGGHCVDLVRGCVGRRDEELMGARQRWSERGA